MTRFSLKAGEVQEGVHRQGRTSCSECGERNAAVGVGDVELGNAASRK